MQCNVLSSIQLFKMAVYSVSDCFIIILIYARMASVAPPTQGTWRSDDYVSAFRLVDMVVRFLWSERDGY